MSYHMAHPMPLGFSLSITYFADRFIVFSLWLVSMKAFDDVTVTITCIATFTRCSFSRLVSSHTGGVESHATLCQAMGYSLILALGLPRGAMLFLHNY